MVKILSTWLLNVPLGWESFLEAAGALRVATPSRGSIPGKGASSPVLEYCSHNLIEVVKLTVL